MIDPENSTTESDVPMSVGLLWQVIVSYHRAIILGTAIVALLYIILASTLLSLGTSQHITTQTFRLDFKGAAKGEYPDGTSFNPSEIVSSSILLEVYNANGLSRFLPFVNFSREVFILQSNPEFERQAAAFGSRLSDPKLNPIDRERIQREWEAKRESIAKNELSLNFSHKQGMPESLVRKSLLDILQVWSKRVVGEKNVLSYRMAVLSPSFMNAAPESTPFITLQRLRLKLLALQKNVDELSKVPGSETMRTAKDRVSLREIALRLDELSHLYVEPLMMQLLQSDRGPATVRFLEAQLSVDSRELEFRKGQSEAIRQSLLLYSSSDVSAASRGANPESSAATQPKSLDAVPQVGDTFLDRLMRMTQESGDGVYRQKLVDAYRDSVQAIVPAQAAVDYDRQLLTDARSGVSAPVDGASARTQVNAVRNELLSASLQVADIYRIMSRNLDPGTGLYAVTAAPVSRWERGSDWTRVASFGLLITALSIPLFIVLSLLHHRIREERRARVGFSPVVRSASAREVSEPGAETISP